MVEEDVVRQIRPDFTVEVHLGPMTDSGINWLDAGRELGMDIQDDDRAARVLSLGDQPALCRWLAYGAMTVNTASVRLDVFASLARMDRDANDEPTEARPT
ncbi:hypothetical protein QFZ40_002165 [Arthrobacter pascens]|nr:hypothetical protein [Arthrobacter pascens]